MVTVLDLGEEQPVGTDAPFGRGEERDERWEPLLTTAFQVARRERIGEGLEPGRVAAGQEEVRGLADGDPLRLQPGQPVVLLDTDAGREGKGGADADEHSAPLAVEEVDVVWDRPAPLVLQMPAVVLADGHKVAGRFARLEDHDDPVGLRPTEIRVDKPVPPFLAGGVEDRDAPLDGSCGDPALVLVGDVPEDRFAHRVELPIGVEEADDSLRLLKRLDQAVQQHPIEAPVREANAIVVMLVEGVHRYLQALQPGRIRSERLYGHSAMQDYHQLDIWQRAMAFTAEIYRFSVQLPDTERYNLTAQLRKAATSVPLNIAEGAGCTTTAEFARFLSYAYRSLKEVVTCLELCQRLYPALPVQPLDGLIDEGNQISRMTHSLMQRLGVSPGAPEAHTS